LLTTTAITVAMICPAAPQPPGFFGGFAISACAQGEAN
jgi:hypothetical protein